MKKVKKRQNSVKILLTIFVIALFIYLIFYYSEKEKEKKDSIITETPSQISPTPEVPITTTIEKNKPSTFISDLKCVNGDISMTFTNILNKEKKLSDFSFFIAGRVNRNPNCDLKVLQPGDSTFCTNLNSGIKFREKVLISVGYPGKYEKAVVDCKKKNSATGNIINDIKNLFIKLFGI